MCIKPAGRGYRRFLSSGLVLIVVDLTACLTRQWLAPALAGLVVRDTPLRSVEVAQMWSEDIARVAKEREERALQKTPPEQALAPASESADWFAADTERAAELYVTVNPPSVAVEMQADATATPHSNAAHRAETSVTLHALELREPWSRPYAYGSAPQSGEHEDDAESDWEGVEQSNGARRNAALRPLVLSARYSLGQLEGESHGD